MHVVDGCRLRRAASALFPHSARGREIHKHRARIRRSAEALDGDSGGGFATESVQQNGQGRPGHGPVLVAEGTEHRHLRHRAAYPACQRAGPATSARCVGRWDTLNGCRPRHDRHDIKDRLRYARIREFELDTQRDFVATRSSERLLERFWPGKRVSLEPRLNTRAADRL